MPSAYHNMSVGLWAQRHPGIARFIDRDDATYERVITVAVVTPEDTGRVSLMMTMDEVGDGKGAPPDSIAIYEVADHAKAVHDATTLAALLGFRARFSTTLTGWLYWDYDPNGTVEFPTTFTAVF